MRWCFEKVAGALGPPGGVCCNHLTLSSLLQQQLTKATLAQTLKLQQPDSWYDVFLMTDDPVDGAGRQPLPWSKGKLQERLRFCTVCISASIRLQNSFFQVLALWKVVYTTVQLLPFMKAHCFACMVSAHGFMSRRFISFIHSFIHSPACWLGLGQLLAGAFLECAEQDRISRALWQGMRQGLRKSWVSIPL